MNKEVKFSHYSFCFNRDKPMSGRMECGIQGLHNVRRRKSIKQLWIYLCGFFTNVSAWNNWRPEWSLALLHSVRLWFLVMSSIPEWQIGPLCCVFTIKIVKVKSPRLLAVVYRKVPWTGQCGSAMVKWSWWRLTWLMSCRSSWNKGLLQQISSAPDFWASLYGGWTKTFYLWQKTSLD